MFDEEIRQSLVELGDKENRSSAGRVVGLVLGIAAGDLVLSAIALAALWPIVDLTVYYVVAAAVLLSGIALAYFLLRLIRDRLARSAQPLLPGWLLKMLAGPAAAVGMVVATLEGPNDPLAAVLGAVAALSVVLSAPVFFALILLVRNKITQRYNQTCRFERIEPDELPPVLRGWFEQSTGDIEALGFRLVGDYRLEPDGGRYARFFVDPSETVYGELSALKGLLLPTWIQATSFTSLLSDHSYIETGNVSGGPLPKEKPLYLRSVANAKPSRVLEDHRAFIAELCEQEGAVPVVIPPERLPVLFHYGLMLGRESLERQALISSNPYEPLAEPLRQAVDELIAAHCDSGCDAALAY